MLRTFEENGKRFVAVPEVIYKEMQDSLKDASRLPSYRAQLAAIQAGEETYPADFVYACNAAETTGERIRLWRKYRSLTQAALAAAIDVTPQSITMLEKGKRIGDVQALKKIALALDTTIDLLIP